MNDSKTYSPYFPHVKALALRGRSPTINFMDVWVVLGMIWDAVEMMCKEMRLDDNIIETLIISSTHQTQKMILIFHDTGCKEEDPTATDISDGGYYGPPSCVSSIASALDHWLLRSEGKWIGLGRRSQSPISSQRGVQYLVGYN